jgi:hypothetical protein
MNLGMPAIIWGLNNFNNIEFASLSPKKKPKLAT